MIASPPPSPSEATTILSHPFCGSKTLRTWPCVPVLLLQWIWQACPHVSETVQRVPKDQGEHPVTAEKVSELKPFCFLPMSRGFVNESHSAICSVWEGLWMKTCLRSFRAEKVKEWKLLCFLSLSREDQGWVSKTQHKYSVRFENASESQLHMEKYLTLWNQSVNENQALACILKCKRGEHLRTQDWMDSDYNCIFLGKIPDVLIKPILQVHAAARDAWCAD